MIKENVLDYFREAHKEDFIWLDSAAPFWDRKLKKYVLTFRPIKAGSILISSGKIVACDPFVCLDEEPFEVNVGTGVFDVILSIASIEGMNQRVAFAMLRITDNDTKSWELAGRESSLTRVNSDKFAPYLVDSGTGCFMDSATQSKLYELVEQAYEQDGDISDEFLWKGESMARYACYKIGEQNFDEVVAFTSGWGDGGYSTYVGFDDLGKPTCLITDFEVVRESEGEL